MIDQLHLEDWAWQVAADAYRLNLFCQLTGETRPKRSAVTEDDLTRAIESSFTQVNDAAYREMVKLATDAALEVYDRVVSQNSRAARTRRAH